MTTDIDTLTGELVTTPDRTLFQTNDPAEILAAAKDLADILNDALNQGGMVQKIGRSDHVKIEGWQTLGSMLGISAHVAWSRPCEGGWEARAEARTADGRVVGAAEAMVTRAERNWRTADDYALRSMAQTRAMSKALRGPLGFIITLAGHSATPAEEVETDRMPYGPAATDKQHEKAALALRALYGPEANVGETIAKLVNDADGYLPKVVARTLMLLAAHRPGRPAAGAGTERTEPTKDSTPTSGEAPVDHSDAT